MIRIFRHYIPKSLVLLGATECLLFYAAVYAAVGLRVSEFDPTDKLLVGALWPKAALFAAVMLLSMFVMGLYERQLRADARGLVFRVSAAFLLGLVVLAALAALAPGFRLGGPALGAAVFLSFVGVLTTRMAAYRYREGDLFRRRVLVVGSGPLAAQAERLRRKTDRRDMELVGYLEVPGETGAVPLGKRIRHGGPLLELVRARGVDELVVALEGPGISGLLNDLLDCKMAGVRVVRMSDFLEEQTGRIALDAVHALAFVFGDGFLQAVVKGYTHRVLDLVLAVVGLAVFSPIMMGTALAIVLESGPGAPVLYRQTRVGRNGRHFRIIKFRSMRIDAEQDGRARFASADDDRVTRVGRFIRKVRFDELPQLFNVLKGEMSFVGPRPERPEFVAELRERIPFYDLRHRVNPGITGWAQVCYPYGADERDAREKLSYDLYYIKNYSLFLDVMILLQTVQVVLWGQGAR